MLAQPINYAVRMRLIIIRMPGRPPLIDGLGILAFSLVFTISLERSRFSKIASFIFVPLWH